jgi:hypothetical protein
MSQEHVLLNSEHFAKSFEVAAFVDLGVGGSMCHTESDFVEMAI